MDWDRLEGSDQHRKVSEDLGCLLRDTRHLKGPVDLSVDSQATGGNVVIERIAEDDWRRLRMVRLTALADAPSSFGSSREEEEAYEEERWRAMIRTAGMFVAADGDTLVGMAAGIPRESNEERGLGAMWVAPQWRGSGVAALLVEAVVGWARDNGCRRVGLWVPADNPRARRFYQRQGFTMTGRTKPFPNNPSRHITEMHRELS